MEEVVQSEVTKHDENRIVAVLPVLGRSMPVTRRQRAKSSDEAATVVNIFPQRIVQVHVQEEVVRILLTRIVRGDDRCWRGQDLLKPIDKECVYEGQMAGMLVS